MTRVNEDDDSLPEERAALEARENGEPLTTLPVDDEAPAAAAADATPPAGDTPPADPPADATPPADTPPVTDPPPGATDGEGDTTDAAPQPTQYQAPTRDWGKERTDLRAEMLAIDKKWSDGELSDEDRATQLGGIHDKLDAITRDQTRAETLVEINRQNAIAEQTKVLDALREAGKKVGLDYGEQKNGVAFDALFDAVAKDPDNAGKGFAELAQKTHETLLAMRGIKAAAEAPAPAPAPAAKPAAPKPNIPQTLHGMTPAAATPIANEAVTALANIDDPEQAEAMLAAMPQAQRQALLHSTVPTPSRRH